MKETKDDKIIVLAGSREQFMDYIRYEDLTEGKNVIDGTSAKNLLGFRAKRIEVVGTFWERKNASEIHEIAKKRLQ